MFIKLVVNIIKFLLNVSSFFIGQTHMVKWIFFWTNPVVPKFRGVTKVYEGETSRNAKVRGEEHLRGIQNQKIGNPLYKHILNDHPHEKEKVKFRMEVKGKFKDPLTRLANEGVRIKNRKPEQLLNSKSEFHQPSIVRLQILK